MQQTLTIDWWVVVVLVVVMDRKKKLMKSSQILIFAKHELGHWASYSWPDIYILHNWATTTKLCMCIINAGALYSSNIILLFVNKVSKILLLPAKEELPLKS